jgi:hypothetical protein
MKDEHMSKQLSKEKENNTTCQIKFPQNKHVTKKIRGNKCGKVGGLLVQKVGMLRKLQGGVAAIELIR